MRHLFFFLLTYINVGQVIAQPERISIHFQGHNLSEDSYITSTDNDELLILIYHYQDSSQLQSPLVKWKFIVDEENRSKRADFQFEKGAQYLLLVIEQDEMKPIEQIDPVIRVFHPEIKAAYEAADRLTIERYLGGEDLLGLKIFREFPDQLKFDGMYKLDRFKYQLDFTRQ